MRTKIFWIMVLAGIWFYSCNDITKGYLEVNNAEYVTDTLFITPEAECTDPVPWQSEEIQGVIGTFPIYYELSAVKDGTGKPADAGITSQIIVVRKGVFQIAKDHTIPVGTYRIDLRVWNLGRSFVLPEVYTLVVTESVEET